MTLEEGATTPPANAKFSVTKDGTTTYYDAATDFTTANVGTADAEVKLLDNFSISTWVGISKNVTLDLNGKKLSKNGPYPIVVQTSGGSKGHFTLKDTSEGQTGTLSGTTNVILTGNGNASPGILTVESGTITATSGTAVYVNNGCESTINGGKINATSGSGIQVGSGNGTLTINGGDISAKWGVVNFGTSEITINGGNITATSLGVQLSAGSLKMDNGSVTGSTSVFILNGSTFTLNDGTINSPNGSGVQLGQNSSTYLDKHDSFTMNGGKIDAESGVNLFNGGASFEMSGGEIESKTFAVSNNGNEWNQDATIKITDGKLTSSNSNAPAIYHAGPGTTNISGGEITGATGVEIRSGELNVTGGKITGNGESYTSTPNSGGSTSSGSGIAIAQHSTKKAITLNISGENTEISGSNALTVSNPQANAKDLTIEANIDGAKLTTTGTASGDKNGNAILADNANVNITVNSGDLTGNVTVSQEAGSDTSLNTTSLKINGGTTTGNVVNAGSATSKVEIGGETSISGDVTSSGDAGTAISGGSVGGTVSNTSATATTDITGGTVKNVNSTNGATKVSGSATVTDSVTTSGGKTDISGEATVKTVTSSGGTTNVSGAAKVTTVETSGGETSVSGTATVSTVNTTSGTTTVSEEAKITNVNNSGGTTNVNGGDITIVKTSGTGKTNITDGTVQTVSNSGEATTEVSGGTVTNTSGNITVPDGYTRDSNGVVRVNGQWTLSGDNYQYVMTGKENSTVIATASDTTEGGLHDTQYKLLAIPTGATLTWNEEASSITSLFSAAQYSTNEGAIAITPLSAGVKIIGSDIVGTATTLTTNDTNTYGITVDATNNSLVKITGGAGADNLKAGNKNATLDGGAGDDTLAGGTGNASLNGGADNNTFVYSAGRDTINAFAEGDTVKTVGLAVTDGSKISSSGNDFTLDFDDGKTLTFTGVTVPVTLNNDTYDYIYTKDLVMQGNGVTLAAAVTTFDASTQDSLSSVETIDASAVTGNVAITDNNISNHIISNGKLTLNYKGGNDIIEGYTYDTDVISVADSFMPPTSFDKVSFDGTNYKISFADADKGLTFKERTQAKIVTSSNDTYSYAENTIALNSSSGNGITLGSGHSTLFNGANTDNSDYDTINAATMTNTARIIGNDRNNYIIGSKGGGTIISGDGNDYIKSSGGSTTLDGGTDGDDTLEGNASGVELFVYRGGADSISGYDVAKGDLVSVRGSGLNPGEATVSTGTNNDLVMTFDESNALSIAGGAALTEGAFSVQSGKNVYTFTKDYVAYDKGITLAAAHSGTFNGADEVNQNYATINAAAVTTAISIVGNDNNNYIVASSNYANSLNGGAGDDTLVGGTQAANLFYYTEGKDVIENFNPSQDKLAIEDELIDKITSGKLSSSKLMFTIDKKSDELTFRFGDDEFESVSLNAGGYLTEAGHVNDTAKSFNLFSNAKGRIELTGELYSGASINSVNAESVKDQSITLTGGTQGGAFYYNGTNKQRDGFEYGGGNVTISGYEGGRDRIDLGAASFSGFTVDDNGVKLNTSGGTISIASAAGEEILLHDANNGRTYQKMVFVETGVVENKKKNPTAATVSASYNFADTSSVKKIYVEGNASAVSIQAGDKNNTIIDASGATQTVSLSGGKKNDKLIGGDFDDTFIYTAGKDIINGYGKGDSISLADNLEANIDSAKITAGSKSIKFKFSNKNTLTVKGVDSLGALNINGKERTYAKNAIAEGNAVSLTSQFSGTFKTTGTKGLDEAVTYVDGEKVTKNLTFVGSDANETLIGGGKKNMFKGGGGADSLVGGTGATDTFFYAKNDTGNATIANFEYGKDKLKVASGKISSISEDGGNVTFSMADGSFKVENTNLNGKNIAIRANNTYYWFADGSETLDSGEAIAEGALITSADKRITAGEVRDFAVIDLNYSTNLVKANVAFKVTGATPNKTAT